MAPIATMTLPNRNAAGTTMSSVARARVHGMSSTAAPAARRAVSATVSDMDTMFSAPVIMASVATASTFPVIRSKRRMGAERTVSRVPRSRSPAVMSMAG